MTELADPQLKGNFPEDEVHIMANLAKECLLLDPDKRPTMSEVVLILSSITRTRSRRRRYIQLCLFQVSTFAVVSFVINYSILVSIK